LAVETINPYTEQALQKYEQASLEDIKNKIARLRSAQREWRLDLDLRLKALKEVRRRLEDGLPELSVLMSTEMGKPITQSEDEIKKCIWLTDYLLDNARAFLSPEQVKTQAKKSYVRFDPLGVVLLIMPWNFPAWQAMRAVMPALAAGNAVLLKHASIVSGTSLKLDEIIGLSVFSSVVAKGDVALEAVKHVDGVSFTGSTDVGTRIGAEAGRQLRKVVLELGGSDPYIVLDDSNLEESIKNCAYARMQNNGQSCIASKRFIVHENAYDDFVKGMREEFSRVKIGDPLKRDTFLGPLSSKDQKDTVSDQVRRLRSIGEVEQLAERLKGNFVPPTIARVDSLFDEEIFGPVAIVKKFRTTREAVELANETPYGLGTSIWGDPEEAEKLVPEIESGMVFINKIVSSDPRLPFGGLKKSGLGVELSRYGLLEFTSKRTIWVN